MTDWPVDLRGVTETVVTTLGPNDRWNAGALGVHAPEPAGGPATATTWGNTRTRRNFHREGGGYVQFVSDPVTFADAALSISESETPILDGADAWAEVEATHTETAEDGDTTVEHWALTPVDTGVVREQPTTTNRGFYAVIEATVAASRLDVYAYDTETLLDRLRYFETVARKCGGPRDREAFERVRVHTDADW